MQEGRVVDERTITVSNRVGDDSEDSSLRIDRVNSIEVAHLLKG